MTDVEMTEETFEAKQEAALIQRKFISLLFT
jgi:hypothetical protein